MDSMPRITIEWQRFEALSARHLYELLRFRQNIFVVEQRCPYPDLDGLDQSAWHLLAWAERGEMAGCLRLIPTPAPAGPVRIGRVATAVDLRRRGIGRMMMTEALGVCRSHYPGVPIALAAQLPLNGFYESFGFVTTSDPYDDFGVQHLEMMRIPGD